MHAAPISSRWTSPTGPHWREWLERTPHLVAEDLAPLRDPLQAWLRPGPAAPPESVAAALARALLPPVAPDPAPAWLRPDQALSFGRSLAAVRRFRGALLADGVGTGKTYIALAVAAALEPGRPVHAVVPAALRTQWEQAARRTGLTVLVHSHEVLSRGRQPTNTPGAVIVDESHRFRTATTRRYDRLSRWCTGRRGLLLSATPAVNRLEDVEHQLLLLVRRDALAWRGATTLEAGRYAGLVITGEDRSGGLPVRRDRDVVPVPAAGSPAGWIQSGLANLALSSDAGIASLLRVVLLEALASSPAAVAEVLTRYQALLEHAGDATAAGLRVTRHRIRQLVGAHLDQLVLWPLVAEPAPLPELALADLTRVRELRAGAERWRQNPDEKLLALRELVADRKPTLVFTTSVATVRYVRKQLGCTGVAWCTGHGSGLDHLPVPRDAVLNWFRGRVPPYPTVLVATDVAAEGLDLPLVQRVVHYDLPWTSVRLEQRSGRALRLSASSAEVEVVRFRPVAEIERALRKEAIIEAKALLPEILGLTDDPIAPWRESARLAEIWRGVMPVEGSAWMRGTESGVVAGVRIWSADGTVHELVMARREQEWTDDPGTIASLLAAARGEPLIAPRPASRLRAEITRLSAAIRPTLRTLRGAAAGGESVSTVSRRAIRRLRRLGAGAMRARNRRLLRLVERGLGFLRRGHTAGEALRVEEWTGLSDRDLEEALAALPEAGATAAERVEVIGLLLVERAAPGR